MRTTVEDWLKRDDSKATKARAEFLQEWRAARARVENVRRYRILTNRTLVEVARRNPENRAALLEVWGIGEKKADQLGRSLLGALRHFRSAPIPEAPPSPPPTRRRSKPQLELRIA